MGTDKHIADKHITKRCITGAGLGLIEAPEPGEAAGESLGAAARVITALDGKEIAIHLLPVSAAGVETVSAESIPMTGADELIVAIPVDRRPVPISPYYAFEPMPLAAPKPATELEERTAPPQVWAGRQPQPPGDDVTCYVGEDGCMHYLIGKRRQAPKRGATPGRRRFATGAFRVVSEIAGMIIVLMIACIVAAGVGMVLRCLADWIGARL